ncbi:MAG: peptide chain release factor N(5)-glutamine methyltransferase [Magnetospirillum gryphiswaldense]|nr:peptide chain release factor N(5)-glutamine methyltransferase [Magnetospirillum gryphiswaldense]
MSDAGTLLRALTARFLAAGVDSARLDARLLVAEVLGVEPLYLATHPELVANRQQQAAIEVMAARRENREPVSHILGRRGFWTLDLRVTKDTLDPRPDTETLVQGVLDRVDDRQVALRLLDFGTGSGCILLALLSELPNAQGLGIDQSAGALAVAADNAARNGLAERARFQPGNWGDDLFGPFDVIVSNPPYIPDADIAGLEPEVARHEPLIALAGGADGLDCYRHLVPEMARLLTLGGLAGFEVGAGQASDVAQLFSTHGFHDVRITQDLAGIDRCVFAIR